MNIAFGAKPTISRKNPALVFDPGLGFFFRITPSTIFITVFCHPPIANN
jgi:hypothetical protein